MVEIDSTWEKGLLEEMKQSDKSNLIIRGIVLTWSRIALVINWHQERVTIWIRSAIRSTRVDFLYYARMSPFGWWNDIFQPLRVFWCRWLLYLVGGLFVLLQYYLPNLVHVGYQIAAETVVSSSELLREVASAVSSTARDIARFTFSFELAWVPLL